MVFFYLTICQIDQIAIHKIANPFSIGCMRGIT